jgi:DUF4097 and DUF4098 domain-containing protein YvlB
MPDHTFETPRPVELYVEVGKGSITVTCADTTTSTVRVEGHDADSVVVEQSGDRLRVVEPRRAGSFFRDNALRVDVVVPLGSSPAVKTGSADVSISGQAGWAQLRSGSGELRLERASGDVQAESGSGDVRLGTADGGVHVKTGSGDVGVGTSGGPVRVSTGSGDVSVEEAGADATVKTGSGNLRVGATHGGLTFSTGSGDCTVDRIDRGQVLVKGASGDVRIGVAAGVPVWTDISTVSGRIRSELEGTGQPVEGQDHVEVRAKTASGDVVLVRA